ncbi:MAG: DDE-type integrase/transposase/recombinase [Actinobacteria bacterium]|nr:DDE-type integrase/transposase/recombinase [Actinomycetota bacterium]MCA1697578.1 DDE-type integrase/transposase/recombinase [Actinomycetota bacterium]
MHDWRETEALWRYGVIRDAVDERLTNGQRGLVVRELAAGTHEHPGGQRRELSRSTVDRWVRAYRASGFDALKPIQRKGVPRTAAVLLEQAVALRREQPTRTGAQIARILARVHGDVAPSARTVERHLARVGVSRQVAAGAPRVFGRFEADNPNELWVSDALHGPVCVGPTGRPMKAICFAILDDHSRLIVAARFVAAETTLGLEGVLRAGLQARGIPQRLYVDNGAPFASGQLARVCAVLGIRLTHSAPGRPQGRGKIERFFRTLRSQMLVELPADRALALPELNGLLTAWIERVYHHATHSQTGQTPVERYCAHRPRHATPDELREAFLWAEQRTVAKTATVSLHANTYEVDPALNGRTVTLLFDPFDLGRVEVRHQGRSFGQARARQIGRHVHPRAQAEPSDDQPAAPTGLDYLAMIKADHDAKLARKISYRDSANREAS